MFVNGRHIVSDLCADSEEGFSSTVAYEWQETSLVDGKEVVTPKSIVRGPFAAIKDAVEYAKRWTDPMNPPEMPAVVPASPGPATVEAPQPFLVDVSQEESTDTEQLDPDSDHAE